MRVLGIDYGTARLGLALSDEEAVLASPLPCQRRAHSLENDLRLLATIAKEHGVGRIVVGLPLNMNGSYGPMAQEALAFADRLGETASIPIELVDERLTTAEAERVLVEAGFSRRRRKGLRDSLAAVLILQDYLDRKRFESPPHHEHP